MNTTTCPICLTGKLIASNYTSTLTNKGISVRIDRFEHSVCDCCESEIANHEQTKNNKLLAIEFNRTSEGFLPPSEILRIRKKLKLSVRNASSIIGGGGIAFSKYENGTIKQSSALDNLLKLLDNHPELLVELSANHQQRQALETIRASFFFEATAPKTEENQPAVFTVLSENKSPTSFKQATQSVIKNGLNSLLNFRLLSV